MENQNYKNHRRLVPMFHYFLFALITLVLIGSFVNLYKSIGDHERIYSADLIVSLSIAMLFSFFFMRIFALKAQDRAIRAEENLRHFALTGKLLDTRLGVKQVIALRFSSDDEFVELAKKAADSNMSAEAIKKAIKNWKGDYYRA
ncbi:MAG: hypothetical protein A3F72_18690 [Bacteroidetes bacterium RIFCSPLOWO2_12_FULL_35_15]|nr:MAG: hypothetical protein A3F72_18690 [Bacteroidetes bacterium RIFCSPLOWO2_12_FULL_35_15]